LINLELLENVKEKKKSLRVEKQHANQQYDHNFSTVVHMNFQFLIRLKKPEEN